MDELSAEVLTADELSMEELTVDEMMAATPVAATPEEAGVRALPPVLLLTLTFEAMMEARVTNGTVVQVWLLVLQNR